MKYSSAILSLAGLAAASPVQLETRQLFGTGSSANDLRGACRPVTLIYARGTTEPGNMGMIIGPQFADALKDVLREDVAIQGVEYGAGLLTNVLPGGADPAGVRDMTDKLNEAVRKCPNTKIVASGYSQGAAVTHGAIPRASAQAKARIAAVVLFGDTQKQQSGGRIDGVPTDRIKIICTPLDGVCSGTLLVGLTHLAYAPTAGEGARFAADKIRTLN